MWYYVTRRAFVTHAGISWRHLFCVNKACACYSKCPCLFLSCGDMGKKILFERSFWMKPFANILAVFDTITSVLCMLALLADQWTVVSLWQDVLMYRSMFPPSTLILCSCLWFKGVGGRDNQNTFDCEFWICPPSTPQNYSCFNRILHMGCMWSATTREEERVARTRMPQGSPRLEYPQYRISGKTDSSCSAVCMLLSGVWCLGLVFSFVLTTLKQS